MTLSPRTRAEHIGPYLLGTYEAELHDTWSRLLQREYSEIVDVGANFGYYAVGLARRFPNKRVVAFDVDWWARKAVAEMAAANGAANVSIESWCDPSWLARHLKHNSLIISDCEGYEGALFCEQWVPAFASCTFVIELHEAFVPGVTERCRAMFADTHARRSWIRTARCRSRACPPRSQTRTCGVCRRRRADLSSGWCSRRWPGGAGSNARRSGVVDDTSCRRHRVVSRHDHSRDARERARRGILSRGRSAIGSRPHRHRRRAGVQCGVQRGRCGRGGDSRRGSPTSCTCTGFAIRKLSSA